MRALWVCAIVAMTGMVLAGPAAAEEPAKKPKPSSYEPHARPPGNAYGMPIGDKILIKRPKKKKKPLGAPAHANSPASPASPA